MASAVASAVSRVIVQFSRNLVVLSLLRLARWRSTLRLSLSSRAASCCHHRGPNTLLTSYNPPITAGTISHLANLVLSILPTFLTLRYLSFAALLLRVRVFLEAPVLTGANPYQVPYYPCCLPPACLYLVERYYSAPATNQQHPRPATIPPHHKGRHTNQTASFNVDTKRTGTVNPPKPSDPPPLGAGLGLLCHKHLRPSNIHVPVYLLTRRRKRASGKTPGAGMPIAVLEYFTVVLVLSLQAGSHRVSALP